MKNAEALDVSRLPVSAMDHRSLVWWGNLWLMVIETTVFALVVAAYFYVRTNFLQWPPPQPGVVHGILRPYPPLGPSTLTLGVLVASFIPMFIADRSAWRMNHFGVTLGLALACVLGVVCAWLRFRELTALPFSWDQNAYTSVVWTIGGMHMLHLIIGSAENFIQTLWFLLHPIDKKHARDVRVNAVYWYWVIGIWIPLYSLIYFAPRIR